jgi:hypothetical protein
MECLPQEKMKTPEVKNAHPRGTKTSTNTLKTGSFFHESVLSDACCVAAHAFVINNFYKYTLL